MKKIKYFNNVVIGEKRNIGEYGVETLEPIYKLTPLEYPCKNEEFEYWLDIIKRSYGEYGEVTCEDIEDIKTNEEIRASTLNSLIIDNKKKDVIISSMAKQISDLNIKLNKMEGDK